MSVGMLAAVLLGAGTALTLLRAVWLLLRRRAAIQADAHYQHPARRAAEVRSTEDVTIEVPPAPEWTPDESLSEDEVAELRDRFGRDLRLWRAQMWNDLDVAQTITQWERPR